MDSLQQRKQRKLNLGPVAELPPNRSSEEFIARHISESPTGQITWTRVSLDLVLLDQPNRRIRSRMCGGVGGAFSDGRPYPDMPLV